MSCFLLFFVAFVVYILIGMLAPFWDLHTVNATFRNKFQTEKFYGDGIFSERAQIVETAKDALDMRIRMIEAAEERIVLATFDIREGESARDVIAALMKAADRGVRVQVLVDGISGLIRMQTNTLFQAMGSYPGIEVRIYNQPSLIKPWTINGRMHDKYLIIDQKMLLMGGRNTFDYFLGEYTDKNLSKDREVFFFNTEQDFDSESAIYQMYQYFESIWSLKVCEPFCDSERLYQKERIQNIIAELEQRYEMLQEKQPYLFEKDFDYIAYTIPIHKATLIYNPTTIYGKEPLVWYQLKELMLKARERVYIHTPYAVFSEEMYQGMAEIQKQVGDVTIQINSVANGDNFCASSDYLYNKSDILDTGVTVYEYEGGDSSHGKSLIIDQDIAVIGSFNFDMRSVYVDTELMFVIHGEEFTKELEKNILTLERDSRKVLDETEYEENSQITVQEISWKKNILMRIAGFFMQFARYLV